LCKKAKKDIDMAFELVPPENKSPHSWGIEIKTKASPRKAEGLFCLSE
jgi:hypothetical protein